MRDGLQRSRKQEACGGGAIKDGREYRVKQLEITLVSEGRQKQKGDLESRSHNHGIYSKPIRMSTILIPDADLVRDCKMSLGSVESPRKVS